MREDSRIEELRWLEQAQADWGWTQHLFEQGAYYLVCFLLASAVLTHVPS